MNAANFRRLSNTVPEILTARRGGA